MVMSRLYSCLIRLKLVIFYLDCLDDLYGEIIGIQVITATSPERRQKKRRHVKTATTKTATTVVKTATVHKSKRRQLLVKTATVISQNGDRH